MSIDVSFPRRTGLEGLSPMRIRKLMIRLPPLLHAALVQIAQQERRSLNAQLLTILDLYARAHSDYNGEALPPPDAS